LDNKTNDMKTNKTLSRLAAGYVLFSTFSVLAVSLMAFFSPQAVMDLVATKLPNNDAISSIRGVYGGVGLTIVIWLLYTLRRNVAESLSFLALFWGLYAASRLMTIMADGQLGAFGTRWLLIEGVFCLTALLLRVLLRRPVAVAPAFS
jgi:hypothetical protein